MEHNFLQGLLDDAENDASLEGSFHINTDLSDEDKAVIFLEAMREECTEGEFIAILESAAELALYGLIPNEEVGSKIVSAIKGGAGEIGGIATEATKTIKVENWKAANFNRIEKKMCITLAKKNEDVLYEKYAKYRTLMIDARTKIYAKYITKAKPLAKKVIANSRNKASALNTPTGQNIVKKMDNQIKKLDAQGRTGESGIKK